MRLFLSNEGGVPGLYRYRLDLRRPKLARVGGTRRMGLSDWTSPDPLKPGGLVVEPFAFRGLCQESVEALSAGTGVRLPGPHESVPVDLLLRPAIKRKRPGVTIPGR